MWCPADSGQMRIAGDSKGAVIGCTCLFTFNFGFLFYFYPEDACAYLMPYAVKSQPGKIKTKKKDLILFSAEENKIEKLKFFLKT